MSVLLSSAEDRVALPALAVCEAQVHAVAGQEGVGVQGKLHAGGVRDGLAKQDHNSGSTWRAHFTAKGTHVTCAVENLQQHKRGNSEEADLDCSGCIKYITLSH